MREKLELKILVIVIGLLVIGVVATGITVSYVEKTDIYSLSKDRLDATSRIITKGIERTMLDGNANVTKILIEDLRSVSGFEDIEVFNHYGGKAFTQEKSSADSVDIAQVVASKSPMSFKKGSTMVFLMPLENSSNCKSCHENDGPVIGVVKVAVSLVKEQEKISGFMLIVTLGSLFGTGFIAFIYWLVMRRMVITPLRHLEESARKMSEGDFAFKTDIHTDDEIGHLDKAIKESLRSISVILHRVKEIATRISNTTGSVEIESRKVIESTQVESEAIANISSSVEELNASITEIAENTEGLATSVEETAASIEEMATSIGSVSGITQELSSGVDVTSSSIEEMSAAIREVADNAENLSKVSEDTLSAVEEIIYSIKEVELSAKESATLSEKTTKEASTLGVTAINKTIQGIQRIKTSVEKTATVIKRLGGRSEEIGKILNVIDEITDQTTLLALNAAILASQAREHGKGFSVVADEIKDLAERTAFSTQEIDSLIQSVRQEVKDAVVAMRDGLIAVEEGLALSTEASEALKRILETSKTSSEMAFSIERSTTEQAKAARHVSDSIEHVRNMVGQIAKATSEQSKGVAFIINAADKIKSASQQVKVATEQQATSSKQIAQVTEAIADRSQQISRAINEQKLGSGQIMDAIETIKHIPKDNKTLTFRVNRSLRDLSKDSDLLITEIETFKLYEQKGESVVVVGVVPLQSPAEMFRKFTPLAEYLSRKLGKRFELKVATDFETAIRDIGKGNSQICYMTPSTYIEAQRTYGVHLMVKALRDGRPFQHSVIITTKDSNIRSLRDLKGRSFAFGDVHSTSSHIVPRAMLLDEGIQLNDLSNYNYLGHHDDVIKAVIRGEFDAGGVMETVAAKYKDENINFLRVSPEIPEFNFCASASLPESDRTAIKRALIDLNEKNADDSTVLKSLDKSYNGFVEAMDEDYNGIRLMMTKLGML